MLRRLQNYHFSLFLLKNRGKMRESFKKVFVGFSLSVNIILCLRDLYVHMWRILFQVHDACALAQQEQTLHNVRILQFSQFGFREKALESPPWRLVEHNGGRWESKYSRSLLQQQRQQLSVFLDLFARYSLGPETGGRGGGRNLGSPPCWQRILRTNTRRDGDRITSQMRGKMRVKNTFSFSPPCPTGES